MPSVINSSTSSGVVITPDTSGVLQFQTASTTAVTIDGSQNVGIGTTSPTAPLHILRTGSASTYINIETQGSVNQNWKLLNAGGSGTFYLQDATASVNRFAFGTNGNLTFNTSNAGIVFNNSSALTNSTLNDYETGTWNVTDASGAGLTFTNNLGQYTKIGNMVYCGFDLVVPSTGNTNALAVTMPFTLYSTARSGAVGGGFVTYTGNGQTITGGYANAGTNYFTFYTASNGANVTNANMSGKEFSVYFVFKASF